MLSEICNAATRLGKVLELIEQRLAAGCGHVWQLGHLDEATRLASGRKCDKAPDGLGPALVTLTWGADPSRCQVDARQIEGVSVLDAI